MNLVPTIIPPAPTVSSARDVPTVAVLAAAASVLGSARQPTANTYAGRFLMTYSGQVGEAVNAPLLSVAKSETILSSLSPLKRMAYFAKNDPVTFGSSIVGVPASMYLIARAIWESGLYAKLLSFAAVAQTQNAQVIAGSSRDTFDWYVGGLMGLVLLGSVCATLFASNESKISFGKDTTKTIVGFIIGFLSGGKVGVR